MNVYLDSSAILKRYLDEIGTNIADIIFDKAQSALVTIIYNILNTGEVIGIFDKLLNMKKISEKEYKSSIEKYFGETLRLLDIKTLNVMPCKTSYIIDSWDYVTKFHLYIVDALQLATAIETKASLFISGDKRLVKVAKELSLLSYNIEFEQDEILEKLTGNHG
ncbi:MAG: type II toxin-antitoxin system VapC family toxin [Promethearchaeota archaeon]